MPLNGKVSGVAITSGAAGLVILLSAYKNATILDTLRAVLRNEKVKPASPGLSGIKVGSDSAFGAITGTGGAGPGSSTGAAVAGLASSYVGKVPYKWGGEGTAGWDCSGFVSYVLMQAGVDIPSKPHTTALGFYLWSGATTVPRDECSPGDLVCWTTHIGIALDKDTMVNASQPGHLTEVGKIWRVPAPAIRRPKAYAAKVNVAAFQ
jgi:cell wall-associated NlpC family hydrolase